MKAIPRFPLSLLSPLSIADSPAAAIKCVAIYEDLAAGKEAKAFLDRLAGVATEQSHPAVSSTFWNFGALGVREMRNAAASAACAADIVVFAFSNATRLPEEITHWINLWLWVNESGRPTVVALSTDGAEQNETAIACIETASRRCGLAFFSPQRSRRAGASGPDNDTARISEAAGSVVPTFA